jgi:post-segregation antitoxin (ccd killing protein)
MSGQEKREMENREKAKTKRIQRIRKRLHLTIDPENHDFIKNSGLNASRLMDTALNEIRTKTNKELIIIIKSNENSGPVEIRTQDLRRVKATS